MSVTSWRLRTLGCWLPAVQGELVSNHDELMCNFFAQVRGSVKGIELLCAFIMCRKLCIPACNVRGMQGL